MQSRVFIVQPPVYLDTKSNTLIPKFDFSSAEKYGKLVTLLSPSAAPFKNEKIVEELNDRLITFGKDDFILCVGNPTLIGIATAIAAHHSDGHIKVLQWHGRKREYIPIKVSTLW